MPVIEIDSLRISYCDTGTGVPVVFVPGLVGSKEWFSFQCVGLSDHYRVIAYDLRTARGKADYSLEVLVDDLARFLAALRIHAAVICGCSLGGLVATSFAATYPERCLELILCSSAPSFSTVSEDDLLDNLLPGRPRFESFFARVWRMLVGSKVTPEDNGPLAALAQSVADLDHPTLAARLKILRETDLTPILEQVSMPTLIVAGSLDTPYILGGSQAYDQGIADAVVEVIEDADRFCFYTRHDLFNALVADFLAHRIARP